MQRRLMIRAVLISAVLWAAGAGTLLAVEPHVFVATSAGGTGSSDAMDVDSPWSVVTDVETIGPDATVRVFFNRIYVVDRAAATVQVIDPDSHETLLTFSVGAGTTPHDIRLTEPGVGYVSRHDSASILKVDPASGATLGSVDLTPLADRDGIPDMSMLAQDGRHLLVQVQRLDRLVTGLTQSPAYVAVVDLDTDLLVDVNPARDGVQGIELVGTIPQFPMHVEPLARRLFVSAPGPRLDVSGGIEEIDLDALESLGFILSEEYSIGDVGGFAMISADAGYAIGHTDIVASSHLFPFDRTPTPPSELYFTFGFMDVLVHDPGSGQLFMPDPFDHNAPAFGVNVFDAATGAQLADAIGTGGPPRDLAVVRATTPGEARELAVTGHDPATGELSLSYRPACGASDHNVVFGALDHVATYGYSGQVCGIGTSGSFTGFAPGAGSWFFLVVGTAGGGLEGSYGGGVRAAERPEDLLDPSCSFTQDLSFSCDR